MSLQFFTNINSVTAWKIFLTQRIKKENPILRVFPKTFGFSDLKEVFLRKFLTFYSIMVEERGYESFKSICDFLAVFYIYNEKYVFRILFSILSFEILLSSRACFVSAPTTPHRTSQLRLFYTFYVFRILQKPTWISREE